MFHPSTLTKIPSKWHGRPGWHSEILEHWVFTLDHVWWREAVPNLWSPFSIPILYPFSFYQTKKPIDTPTCASISHPHPSPLQTATLCLREGAVNTALWRKNLWKLPFIQVLEAGLGQLSGTFQVHVGRQISWFLGLLTPLRGAQ